MSDQDPVCIRELREALQIQDGWLNGGMPFIDHVFDGKTGREIARENLKRWACKHPRRIGQGSMSCDIWATSWRCLDCGYSEEFSG